MSEYTKELLLCVLVIGLMGAFQFSYQLTVTNGASAVLIQFLNVTLNGQPIKSISDNQSINDQSISNTDSINQSISNTDSINQSQMELRFSSNELTEIYGLYLASQMTGGILGPSLAAFLSDRFGRRPALIIVSTLIIIALIPACLAKYFTQFFLLVASKFLIGVSCMAAINVGTIYVTEISPVSIRGSLAFILYTISKTAQLVGTTAAVPIMLGSTDRWPFIFHAQLGLAFGSFFMIFLLCKESPHYLMLKKRTKQARDSIQHYQGIGQANVDSVLHGIENELCMQRQSLSVWQAFKHPATKRGMQMSVMLGVCNSTSGIDVLLVMSTLLFVRTGFSESESSYVAAFMTVGVLAITIFGVFAVEKFGRRPLIIGGSAAIAVINFACFGLTLGYNQTGEKAFGYAFLVVMLLFFFGFTLGPGGLTWLLPAELVSKLAQVPVAGRAAAQCVCSTLMCISAVFITAVFLVLQSRLGPAAFLVFAVPMMFFTAYFWKFLPETRNRRTDEIAEAQMSKNDKKFSDKTTTV